MVEVKLVESRREIADGGVCIYIKKEKRKKREKREEEKRRRAGSVKGK